VPADDEDEHLKSLFPRLQSTDQGDQVEHIVHHWLRKKKLLVLVTWVDDILQNSAWVPAADIIAAPVTTSYLSKIVTANDNLQKAVTGKFA
jgi:hypothetical protein